MGEIDNRPPKLSIVMSYFNRLDQCIFTLQTLELSKRKNEMEVIIIDDCSTMSERILQKYHINQFSFPIKVYKIPKHVKNWKNPVIPYNYGITKAKATEWIIIQNPECCHVGDICDFVLDKCDPAEYHTMTVFASKDVGINNVIKNNYKTLDDSNKITSMIGNKIPGVWYNHIIHRREAFHFCSAIHISKLKEIGGFNPEMKDGYWYDDNEIIVRIYRAAKKVNIWDISKVGCFAIHQWHEKFYNMGNPKEIERLRNMNLAILNKTKNKKDFIYTSPHYQYLQDHESEIEYLSNF